MFKQDDTGYAFDAAGVKTLKKTVADVRKLVTDGKSNPAVPEAITYLPWRAVVVGISADVGGRKTLDVQALQSRPFGYGGPIIKVDGWIDSGIVCGMEVLCLRVKGVIGDPEDNPPYVALPQYAFPQEYLVEPANDHVVRVVDAVVPTTQDPCSPQ